VKDWLLWVIMAQYNVLELATEFTHLIDDSKHILYLSPCSLLVIR
jgi:hypothetical protein